MRFNNFGPNIFQKFLCNLTKHWWVCCQLFQVSAFGQGGFELPVGLGDEARCPKDNFILPLPLRNFNQVRLYLPCFPLAFSNGKNLRSSSNSNHDLHSAIFVLQLYLKKGRGGGKMVSMLAFYSDDPSANPTGVLSIYCVKLFEKNEKRQGIAHL